MRYLENLKNRKVRIYFVVCIMLINSLATLKVTPIIAKDNVYIVSWERGQIIDDQLKIQESELTDERILLDLEFHMNGTYQLEYFLNDNERTQVDIRKTGDGVEVDFNLFYIDASTTYSITRSILEDDEKIYEERDYETGKMVRITDKADTLNGEGAIEFPLIEESTVNKFTGFEFNIDQRNVIIKWDSSKDRLYYYMDNYNKGNVMPVTVRNPEGTNKTINILNSLDEFNTTPTQYQLIGGVLTEIEPVVYPRDELVDPLPEILPGKKPGIDISFMQPSTLNSNYVYDDTITDFSDFKAKVVLEEFGDGPRLDFEFLLSNPVDTVPKTITSVNWDAVNNDANGNSNVAYELNNKEYLVKLVEDKSSFTSVQQQTMIQWTALEPSKVYEIKLSIEPVIQGFVTDIERDEYRPITRHAYTYLEYELIRNSIEEAFLRITPYNVGSDEEVVYKILASDSTSTLTLKQHLWLTHYYENELGSTAINIPVPFDSETDENNYKVIIDYAGNIFGSQVLKYDATVDNYVENTTPIITEVDQVISIPSDTAVSKRTQFDLVWKAPTADELKVIFEKDANAVIYYELMANQYYFSTEENEFKVIKVFEVVSKDVDFDGEAEIVLQDYSGTPGIAGIPEGADESQNSDYADYQYGYNEEEGLLRMNDIVVYDEDFGWINEIASNLSSGGSAIETGTPYEFNYENYKDYEKDEEDNGVNYLKMRAITSVNGNPGEGLPSLPISLTLSDIEKNISIPDGLSYEINDDKNITLNFNTVDIDEYEQYMLTPLDREVTQRTYRVFLASGDKVLMNDLPEDYETDPDYIQVSKVLTDSNVTISASDREVLREIDDDGMSKVLYFDYSVGEDSVSISSVLNGLDDEGNGLDPNGTYYVRIQAITTETDIENPPVDDIPNPPQGMASNASGLSNQIEITMPSQPDEPDDSEIAPIAIDNLVVDFAEEVVNGSLVKVETEIDIDFDYSEEIKYEEGLFGFEVIALEDISLPKTLQSKGLTLESVLSSFDDPVVEGWRTIVTGSGDSKEYHLSKYTGGEWGTTTIDTLKPTVNHITITDKENAYNRVYYYYVRTIKLNPEDDPNNLTDDILSNSSWSAATITTNPVKEAINLEVLYNSGYTYDPQYSAIITFDAPIPYGDKIGDQYTYDLEVYVKGEEDSTYSHAKYRTTMINKTADGDNGYTRYYYRIDGLESGSTYNIKVRVADYSNAESNGEADKSRFSNIAIARTEFNQEDYDQEVAKNKYIDLYEERVEQIKYQPYFMMRDDGVSYMLKYREDYGVSDLQIKANDTYGLDTKEVVYNVYYLPSNYVEEVNNHNVMLEVEANDTTFTLRRESIGKDYTDVIKDYMNKIDIDEVVDEDYYIRLKVVSLPYQHTINGKEVLGDVVDINLTLVGSYKTEEELDILMLEKLDQIVYTKKIIIGYRLQAELDKGINEDRLLEIVNETVDETIDAFSIEVYGLMNNNFSSTRNGIYELANNMQVTFNYTGDAVGMPHINDGIWREIDYVKYGEKYLIDTPIAAEFSLLKWNSVYERNLDNYTDQELEVINKFSLDDILGIGLLNSPDANYYYHRLIRTCSSVMGYVGDYEDCYDYLEEQGVELPLQGEYTYTGCVNAFVLLTQVYCLYNDINIGEYEILDYNQIENINEIDKDYQKILRVGVDLGLIDLNDGEINIGHYPTIKELIENIHKIDQGN